MELAGWVAKRRDHGKIIFIDLRDKTGVSQLVFTPPKDSGPGSFKMYDLADDLRSECVIRVEGIVKKRPKGMENPKLKTGAYEVEVKNLDLLSDSKTPPFDIEGDGYDVNEEIRMQYRYLDLRRERLKKNLQERAKIIKFIRDFLIEREFIEVETPILGKSTPEGARDYLVPARLHAGKFYALPQSPQQYKQLLMIAGLERYFQIARCFRDEDTRGDRQPEFTQLDLEMSFVEEKDVMAINEELLIALIKHCAPKKKIQEIPFPRLIYKEAMEKYSTDRPDLRKNKNDSETLAFCWIVDFPFFEKDKSGTNPLSSQSYSFEPLPEPLPASTPGNRGYKFHSGWTFTHNPFSAPKGNKENYIEFLRDKVFIDKILTTQYDVVLNGWEIGGGSIRNHDSNVLREVFMVLGYSAESIEKNFGHILDALSYGAPPHGGIAWGLDRLIMILQNEPNIREVIAFPKTGDGRDLLMDAPSEVDEKQLKELHIKVVDKK